VDKSFGSKKPHFERTVYWLLQLKPDADEAMQAAAYGHDIGRAFAPDRLPLYVRGMKIVDPRYVRKHEELSGNKIYEFLISCGAEKKFAMRVKNMVSHHESGGDEESNLIKDADSISYFENNAGIHLGWIEKGIGKVQVREKYDFMLDRITLEKARRIARPFYKKWVRTLNRVRSA